MEHITVTGYSLPIDCSEFKPEFLLSGENIMGVTPMHHPPQPFAQPLTADLIAGLGLIFAEGELVGFYLGGSIALGDFNPDTSDLDFIAVTADAVTDAQIEALRKLHDRLHTQNSNRLYQNCEGDYLSADQALHPATGVVAPRLSRGGQLRVEEHGSELLIDLWKVRKNGFVVCGRPPQEIIGEITTEQLIAAKVALFKGWWLPKLERQEPMSAGYQVYAVLTMARILYGLSERDEVSKPASAVWMATVYPQFAALLELAVNWRDGEYFNNQGLVYGLIEFVRDRIVELERG